MTISETRLLIKELENFLKDWKSTNGDNFVIYEYHKEIRIVQEIEMWKGILRIRGIFDFPETKIISEL